MDVRRNHHSGSGKNLSASVGAHIFNILLSRCVESSSHVVRASINLNEHPLTLRAVLDLPEKHKGFTRIAKNLSEDWYKGFSRFGLKKVEIVGADKAIQDFNPVTENHLVRYGARPISFIKPSNGIRTSLGSDFRLKNPLMISNGDTLSSIVENSLPHAVRLMNLSHYMIKCPDRVFQLVTLELSASSEDKDKINDWKKELQEKVFSSPDDGLVILKIRDKHFRLTRHLSNIAGEDGVLDQRHLKKLLKLKGTYTKDDLKEKIKKQHPSGLIDLTHVPFDAIDSPGTEYREDLVHVHKLTDGSMFVRVAISDVTWLVKPGSEDEQRIKDIAFSVFGSPEPLYTVTQEVRKNSNFALNRKRPAWVFAFIVNTRGQIIPQGWGRALVASHREIDPANPGDNLKIISEVGGRLFAGRMQKGFVKVKDDSNTAIGMALTELMIATKVVAGDILMKTSGQKLAPIYRVQLQPDRNRIKDIAQAISKEIGIDISVADFFEPLRLTSLIRILDETSNSSHLQEIIDAMFGKSSYSLVPSGHNGIGIEHAYVDLKARSGTGYYSQGLFRTLASGGEIQPPFPDSKPAKLARMFTDNKGHKILQVRYRMLDRLVSNLEKIGESFSAVLLEGAEKYIEVEGFNRWGIIDQDHELPPGEQVTVKLSHFDLNRDRLVFKIDSSSNVT